MSLIPDADQQVAWEGEELIRANHENAVLRDCLHSLGKTYGFTDAIPSLIQQARERMKAEGK